MKPSPVFLLLALAALALAPLQARTWTSTTGSTIDAEFLSLNGQTVTLKLGNGKTVQLSLDKLSPEDQAFVKELTGVSDGPSSWPQWRGADQSGISPESGLMDEWPEGGPEKLWTYSDAGFGYSSFSFADGRLYTLGTRDDKVVAIALDSNTGEELWAASFGPDDQSGYNAGWGHGSRSTPTYSDGKVYVLGPKGDLACLNAEDGSEVWSKNIKENYSGKNGGWGYSESPVVDEGKVLVSPGGNTSSVIALNKDTGSVIWEADVADAGPAEYATIVVAEIDERRQYIKLFQQQVVGLDASNGDVIWTSPWPRGRTAVIPTPIVDGNMVYITAGYSAGSKLFKVEGSETTDIWDNTEMKNHHGGVVKVGDYLYGFSDGAGLACQSWETGELVWNERGQYTSKGAVHVADGKLFTLNEGDGTVILAEATPEGFENKGQFTLEPQSAERHTKGKIWSHPVVFDGKLYLRDQQYISCYKVKE